MEFYFLLSEFSVSSPQVIKEKHAPRPVVFYSGNRRFLVDPDATYARRADGTARFNGHEDIHQNSRGYFLVTNGRCAWCGSEKCRSRRTRVVRSIVPPRSSAGSGSRRMRVKGNTKGRKRRFDEPLLREIDPSRGKIRAELSELAVHAPLAPWGAKFDNIDAQIRSFELEEKAAWQNGGLEAQRQLRSKYQADFVSWLRSLESNPGYARHCAEYIVKWSDYLFEPNAAEEKQPLESFRNMLMELRECADGYARARKKAIHQKLELEAKKRASVILNSCPFAADSEET